MSELKVTERSRLRRSHERGAFDRETINAILDAGPLCHVAYTIDGKVHCLPTFQWREGNRVYWHGSSAGRMLRNAPLQEVCLTVTHMDGYVIARSAFHHSVNYRSVMLFGTPEKVEGDEAATEHLKTFVDQIFPGRWDTLRPMNDKELKATTILSIAIEEGAAKIRTGDPVDDDEDYALPIWAGTLPIEMVAGQPKPDARLDPAIPVPDDVKKFTYR